MKRCGVILVMALAILGCLEAYPVLTAQAAPIDLYYDPSRDGLDFSAIKLFLLGVGLLFLELFIPGFGICGIGGICCLVASFYFALGGSRDTLLFLTGGSVLVLVGGVVLMKYLPHNPLWRRLALRKTQTETAVPAEQAQQYLGKRGVAQSLLRPSGVALLEDKRVDVITEGDFIPAGTPIVVVRVEGIKIFVEKEQ